MTANTGKGADGKRPTGEDAKRGRQRKKTSAAKPPSDEVTVRTNESNGTASQGDTDDTVIDVPIKNPAARDAEPEVDDDATVIDTAPGYPDSSSGDEMRLMRS